MTRIGELLNARPAPLPLPEPGDVSAEQARLLISCVDATTLDSRDTPEVVMALCDRAKELNVAAVCVHSYFVGGAKRCLTGAGIRVATVAGGFPHGLMTRSAVAADVAACVEQGADEVDIVIPRTLANRGEWEPLADRIGSAKDACGKARLKVILSTGELADHDIIWKTSLVALAAGADFLKTSTGKEETNAELDTSAVMLQAIAAWRDMTGETRGFKAAGGIRTGGQAWAFADLAAQIMGDKYLRPTKFRIGASSLLDDLSGRL